MALLEAAMEDDKGQHGDISSSKSADDRFSCQPAFMFFRSGPVEMILLCARAFAPARGGPRIWIFGLAELSFILLSSIRILLLQLRKVGNASINVEVGRELFWYTFKRGPAPEDGCIELDEARPSCGLTVDKKGPKGFDVFD